jgi:hypothetical protein
MPRWSIESDRWAVPAKMLRGWHLYDHGAPSTEATPFPVNSVKGFHAAASRGSKVLRCFSSGGIRGRTWGPPKGFLFNLSTKVTGRAHVTFPFKTE